MGIEKAWNLLVGKLVGWIRQLILLLPNLTIAVLVVVVSWLAARLVRSLAQRLLGRISHSPAVNRLLAQAFFVATLAAGVFVSLGILGLDKTVTSLLAGAGILGLALGFAFQDIAANVLAGIYLSVRHPFRRGHLIQTKEFFGTVQAVTLRWTELRTQQGQLVLIPNKLVFENPITNYNTTGKRRVDIDLGISYGADLEAARRVVTEALQDLPGRDRERDVEFFYDKLGAGAVAGTVRLWIEFKQQTDYLEARSAAIQAVKRACEQAGIALPFPVQTLDFSAVGGTTLAEVLAAAGLAGRGAGEEGDRVSSAATRNSEPG
jgi:small conductance mechanosensitive channel